MIDRFISFIFTAYNFWWIVHYVHPMNPNQIVVFNNNVEHDSSWKECWVVIVKKKIDIELMDYTSNEITSVIMSFLYLLK